MKIHIVQKGETLWEIAQQSEVSFEELKKMNTQLTDPDELKPGMKIKIPTDGVPVKKEKSEKETKEMTKAEKAEKMEKPSLKEKMKEPGESEHMPPKEESKRSNPPPSLDEHDGGGTRPLIPSTDGQTQSTGEMPDLFENGVYPEFAPVNDRPRAFHPTGDERDDEGAKQHVTPYSPPSPEAYPMHEATVPNNQPYSETYPSHDAMPYGKFNSEPPAYHTMPYGQPEAVPYSMYHPKLYNQPNPVQYPVNSPMPNQAYYGYDPTFQPNQWGHPYGPGWFGGAYAGGPYTASFPNQGSVGMHHYGFSGVGQTPAGGQGQPYAEWPNSVQHFPNGWEPVNNGSTYGMRPARERRNGNPEKG